MTSPIERMVDAIVRCAVCGKPPSARCRCHEPKDPVRLRCEVCQDELVVERSSLVDGEGQPIDFEGTEISTRCPKHPEE